MPSMFIGGAEKSLIGLLDSLKEDDIAVDLFLFRHEGELLTDIPEHISILPEIPQYTTFDRPIKDLLKSKLFNYGIFRLISKVDLNLKHKLNKINKGVWTSMQYTSKYVSKLLPQISGQYDLAISFLGVPFYMDKVNAKTKMAWIHTDYDILYPDKKKDREAFSFVDYIVNVSDGCKDKFDKHYPELKEKSIMIENILPKNYIINKASLMNDEIREINTDTTIKLLSIGRFCEAKNFDNVPNICKRILNKGLNIKWYLIGYGGDEQLIKDKIKEEGMKEHVIMLGKKDNPYPYIKACDYYVQPSRYEGKAVTVREAQILEKPVIITRYATSSSQLDEGIDGVIVPMDNEGCAQGIVDFINNKELQDKIVSYLKEKDYSNSSEIEKIYELMG